MVRNSGISDPIQRTREMKEIEFTKYTMIRKKQFTTGEMTDADTVNKIRETFYAAHTDVPNKALDGLWAVVGPRISQNAGLAQFTLDYHGAESKYFFPWLKAVYTSPSEALEMSYGAGRDLNGTWVERTDTDDPIEGFVCDDPTFVYNRERQMYVADLVTTLQKKEIRQWACKIVDLGAGRLAWARWHGFKFDPWRQTIIACDKDKTIRPEELFRFSLKELGLTYKICDMTEALTSMDCARATLVMLGGVASYVPMETFTGKIIPAVWQLLKSGGAFFFDLQADCPYLRRSMSIFDWPKMNFYGTAAETIAVVEKIRKDLWKLGMKFGAEYTLDTYNAVPSSVMVLFTKL